jgi:hypothetical protein
MTIPLARKIDGKKFMWDGMTYDSLEKAQEVQKAYEEDGFEVALVEEEGSHLVYNRRVAAAQTA